MFGICLVLMGSSHHWRWWLIFGEDLWKRFGLGLPNGMCFLMCTFSWHPNTGIGEFYWFFFFVFSNFLSNPFVRFDLLIFLGNQTQGSEYFIRFFFFNFLFCPLVNSLRLDFNFMSLIHLVGVLVNLFWSEYILVILQIFGICKYVYIYYIGQY